MPGKKHVSSCFVQIISVTKTNMAVNIYRTIMKCKFIPTCINHQDVFSLVHIVL